MKKYLFLLLLPAIYLVALSYGRWESGLPPVDPAEDDAVLMELPDLRDEDQLIISHTGYTLSYNAKTNCPDWVAWELTGTEASTAVTSRNDDFRGDPEVPEANRVQTADYRGSGFDRGHMCPAADMKWSVEAMSDCFYMTNICPQVPVLNQKWWEHLERACRRWAQQEGTIYICCGPIYYDEVLPQFIGRDIQVRVPEGFFKVILSLQKGNEKAIAFVYRNTDERQTMEDALTTVDEVEQLTGLNFFPTLDPAIKASLEKQMNLRIWN